MKLRHIIIFPSIITLAGVQAWGLNVTTSPGQLESMIHTDPAGVTELCVGGAINAVDLQFIADKMPALRTLDISNATIAAYEGNALTTGAGSADAHTIPPYSLAGLRATSITLPKNLQAIGEGAFAGSSTTAVTIPPSVTTIGMGAFAGCNGITSLTVPASVTVLEPHTFTGMANLASIDIKAQIVSVPAAAFAGDTKLSKVTLPSTIAAIDSAAFSGCSALAEIQLPQSVTRIGASAFRNTALTRANLEHTGLTSIGDWAFADIETLSEVSLPESLTSIGKGAFFGDKALTDIAIPHNVLEIADYAFANNTAMTAGHLNGHILTIGDFALKGWASTEFTLPANLEYLGDYAMEGWEKVTKINAEIGIVPLLGTAVWKDVDQPSVTLYVPEEHAEEYRSTPQWQEFNVTAITGVEDVAADAAGRAKVNGYFRGTDMIIESSLAMESVEVYTTAGIKLMALQSANTTAIIDTEGWNNHIFIVRIVLDDDNTVTLKLARR